MHRPSPRLLAALCLAGLVAGCSNTVTVRQMIGNDDYWPQKCRGNTCVLTGYGGLVDVWQQYVDDNARRGRSFAVKGVCASACEMAYRRAVSRGARVTVASDARLIAHDPAPAKWN
jgi:hypothetical protein